MKSILFQIGGISTPSFQIWTMGTEKIHGSKVSKIYKETERVSMLKKRSPRKGNIIFLLIFHLNFLYYSQILHCNIPILMDMQICTFFHPDLFWKKQLTPLIGQDEVERMDSKLKELNVKGLDTLKVFYTSMFPSPPYHMESKFADLLRDIGAWPTVSVQIC